VLDVFYRMRQEVTTHPQWFEPDAVERVDKAIASIHQVRLKVKAA
jgi:hypothetical protein